MSTLRPHQIQLISNGRREEGRAASAITPGMLIALTAAGAYEPHDASGKRPALLFALEDALQGRTIDDAYATDELVQIGVQVPGDVVFAWLAAGETVTPDMALTSNGDGFLKEAGGSDGVIGNALESMDLSGSDDDDTRIRVRLA